MTKVNSDLSKYFQEADVALTILSQKLVEFEEKNKVGMTLKFDANTELTYAEYVNVMKKGITQMYQHTIKAYSNKQQGLFG